MGYVAKLVRGAKYIDLSSGRYDLGLDFKPLSVGGAARSEAAGAISWGFTIKVTGASSAEVRRGVDDVANFLEGAGDTANPTYFEWTPDNNVSAAPVWGQFGAARRVKIYNGQVDYWDNYFQAEVRGTMTFAAVSMTVSGEIEGVRQLAATAKGGVSEDWIGTTDGHSRGVTVPDPDETNGNYFYNPIFSSSAWGDTWGPGAGATFAKNINPKFIPFGNISARLASTSDTTGILTANINVGDTGDYMLSTYVIQENLGALTSTNAQLHYNGTALTTTFANKGNGFYRISAPVVGAGNSAVPVGILAKASNVIYTGGFQLEKRKYLTPLMCGDFLGHSWQGTPHGSRSMRNTAYLRLPVADVLDSYVSTMRFVWTPDRSSAIFLAGAANGYIFHSSVSASFRLYFDFSADRWDFMGSPTAGAVTFPAGTPIVFHVISNNGTYSLYINGAFVLTAASPYQDPASGYLYLGSSSTPDQYCGGTLGTAIAIRAFSAAEVLADYNNIAQLIADGQSVDPIPYVWTKDGDNIVDNVDSGTSENWCVIGGVQGDLPAEVEAKLTVGGMNAADAYIGRLHWDYDQFIDPDFLTNASLGTVSVTNSDTTLTYIPFDDDEFRLIADRKLSVMVRAIEGTANNLSLRTGISPGGAYYYTPYLSSNWGTAGTTTIDSSPEIYFVRDEEFYRTLGITRAGSVFIGAKRNAGTANLIVHSVGILPSPTTRFVNQSAGTVAPTILYTGGKAFEATGTSLQYGYTVQGAPLQVMPNKYNVLVSYLGREAVTSAGTNTLTYSAVYITPRWKAQ
jgi:hypothetical protein